MNQDKMYLINKLFNDKTIRTVWDKDEEKYYVSVTDVVGAVSESKDGRKYWNKLKQRLKKEGTAWFLLFYCSEFCFFFSNNAV